MAGFLVDCAVFPAATITSNAPWTGLDRIKTMPTVDAAVSSRLGTAADPLMIDILIDQPEPLSYGGLCAINLEQPARWRLEAFDDDDNILFDTRSTSADAETDLDVMPGVLPWDQRQFGASNFLRGDLPRRVWMQGEPAIHCPFPRCAPARLRWSLWGDAFAPDGSAASYVKIGYAPIGDGVEINRTVGSSDKIDPQATVTRIEGGGAAIDPGVWNQINTINLALLDAAERDRLTLMLLSAGADLPVVWLPDVDDPAQNFMWGGVRRVGQGGEWRWGRPIYTDTVITLEKF